MSKNKSKPAYQGASYVHEYVTKANPVTQTNKNVFSIVIGPKTNSEVYEQVEATVARLDKAKAEIEKKGLCFHKTKFWVSATNDALDKLCKDLNLPTE